MNEIKVNASRKYVVTVADSWERLRKTVDSVTKGTRIAVITDETVAKFYLDEVTDVLKGYEIFPYAVPAGENSKSMGVYSAVMEYLAENSFRRDDTVLALGGGVVGDLAAFAASTYMRGIRLIAVPTTLLSMIDSSVGGKTAINLGVGKNLCGTFYQPYAVYANVKTLSTLPEREILCGKGELAKYAVLSESISADDIDNYNSAEVIAKCISVKRDIVEADEFESGKRMLLNLGHTVGHAVEALSDYTIPHGICVLKGLYAAAFISKGASLLSEKDYSEIIDILKRVDEDISYGFSSEDILKEISVDKKSVAGGVNFVYIKKKGECEVRKTDTETLRRLLNGDKDN